MSANLLFTNYNPQPIIDEIGEFDPDVLLVQEYTPHWHKTFQESQISGYPYAVHEVRDDPYGMAIYSRHLFAEPVETTLSLGPADIPQMRAVIAIHGIPVAFYNLHLYPTFEGLDNYLNHRRQFNDLLKLVARESHPVVLAGDFNFIDIGLDAMLLYSRGFDDTLTYAGLLQRSTWPVKSFFRWFPGVRLDHIYFSRELLCVKCTTGTGRGSDHRPVLAEIALRVVPTGDHVTVSDATPVRKNKHRR